MSVSIELPAGDPLFEGHFPGRPILPGIAELVLVWRVLSHPSGPPEISGIPFARFRGLVVPSDVLQISVEPGRKGGDRFEVRRGVELVANGALALGVPRADGGGATAVASRAPRGAPPLRDLIPHRPPMLFVERIIGVADDGATCLGRVPRDCALVAGGSVPAFVALEAAAQTAAVWEALLVGRTHPARPRRVWAISSRSRTSFSTGGCSPPRPT